MKQVREAVRFVAGHAHGLYTAIAAYLSLSFLLFLFALVGFGMFAEEVLEGGTQRFDEAALHAVSGLRADWLDHVMLEVTGMGNTGTVVVVVLLAGLFLWLTRHHLSVYLLGIAVVGGNALNLLLKGVFARPRPSVVEQTTEVATASFPSGHAMMATIAYGSVAYLVGRLEPTRTMRLTTWTLAVLIILLIGFSRIYLGVHYPTDVAAGFIAGAGWVAFVVAGMAGLTYLRRDHPEIEQVEEGLERGAAGDEGEEGARAAS